MSRAARNSLQKLCHHRTVRDTLAGHLYAVPLGLNFCLAQDKHWRAGRQRLFKRLLEVVFKAHNFNLMHFMVRL